MGFIHKNRQKRTRRQLASAALSVPRFRIPASFPNDSPQPFGSFCGVFTDEPHAPRRIQSIFSAMGSAFLCLGFSRRKPASPFPVASLLHGSRCMGFLIARRRQFFFQVNERRGVGPVRNRALSSLAQDPRPLRSRVVQRNVHARTTALDKDGDNALPGWETASVETALLSGSDSRAAGAWPRVWRGRACVWRARGSARGMLSCGARGALLLCDTSVDGTIGMNRGSVAIVATVLLTATCTSSSSADYAAVARSVARAGHRVHRRLCCAFLTGRRRGTLHPDLGTIG